MSVTWTPKKNCPQNVKDLRKALLKNMQGAKGAKLISKKFNKDHLFPGHSNNPAVLLASLRSTKLSTLISSEIVQKAEAEVKNWVNNVPDAKFTLNKKTGTWTVSKTGSAVGATAAYKLATVDLAARKKMDADDLVKKARKWVKFSKKVPSVACHFDNNGMPQIYHLNF